MKLFNILIFLIFISSLPYAISKSEEFDCMRMVFNLYSVASSPSNTIIAGDYGCIMLSADHGLTWSQKRIGEDNINFNKAIYHNNKFYVLGESKYILISEDLVNWETLMLDEKENNLDFILDDKDNIYILHNNIIKKYYNGIPIDTISIFGETSNKLYLYNNNLLFSLRGNIYYYDLSSMKLDSINISDKGVSVNHWSEDNNNNIFARIGSNVYKIDIAAKNITYKFISQGSFDILNNNYGVIEIKYLPYYSEFYYTTYNEFGDTIISNDKNDPKRLANFIPFDLKFLDDDVILVAGSNKTILRSSNKGKNWEYISNADRDSISKLYFFKSAVLLNPGKKHFRSNNGGITWLPEYYDSIYHNNNNMLYKMAYTNINRSFKDLNNYFFLDPYTTPKSGKPNIALTNDRGNTFKYYVLNELANMDDKSIDVIEEENKNIILLTPYKAVATLTYNYDKEFGNKNYYFMKDVRLYSFYKKDTILYALGTSYLVPDSIKTGIFYTSDYGQTWNFQTLLFENAEISVCNRYDNKCILKIKFLKENKYKVYEYDFINNNIILLDAINWAFYIKPYRDKFIGMNDSGLHFFERGDTLALNKVKINYPSTLRLNNFFVDEDTIWNVTQSKPFYHFEKITPKISTPVVENKINSSYLYISGSSPNPAETEAYFSMTWNINTDFSLPNLKAFDLLGNLVSNSEDFHINQQSEFSADVVWNCSNVKPGVYFIKAKSGGAERTTRIVVKR